MLEDIIHKHSIPDLDTDVEGMLFTLCFTFIFCFINLVDRDKVINYNETTY